MNFVEKIDDRVPIRRVLVSVYDKSGLERFIPGLLRAVPDLTIYSTGGSYRAVAGILDGRASGHLVAVSEYTGQPEMQGGLVKTLDFKIYLGLLSETYNPAHTEDLNRAGALVFDMVVVNLYPFQQTVSRAEVSPEQARANIDIGGPCLIRAAAKNYLRVASVVDPRDYAALLRELEQSGGRLCLRTRFALAGKAFSRTAEYDDAVAAYLGSCRYEQVTAAYSEIL
jgi:phosphoribosylaminoimidazolecarboxamide formyltransferase/IMP cyclohydrolase